MLLWRRSEWCIHCSSGVGCVREQEDRRRIHRCQCLKESGERVEEGRRRERRRRRGRRRGLKRGEGGEGGGKREEEGGEMEGKKWSGGR